MHDDRLEQRLGVCSWSLRPANLEDLVTKLRSLELTRLQLALGPLCDRPTDWTDCVGRLEAIGVTIVSGMFGTVGEDYSSLDSIRRTGGLVPDGTWKQNQKVIMQSADVAATLGLTLVTFHAGFIPEDDKSYEFATILDRVRRVALSFGEKGMGIALETGQERAEGLRRFLEKLDEPNVFVNFDPANMILYDKGDPVEAVRALGPFIRQVHVKDAVRTDTPGQWGREVAVGTGEVDWPAFLAALRQVNFTGDFIIEREAGSDRRTDVRGARDHLLAVSRMVG